MRSGFVNLLKPAGATSHDMVNAVRRIFATRSVGHMGTLDPAAAGVLPMAVGKATRLIPYVEGGDKVYRAEIWFGFSTDTEDTQGRVLHRQEVSGLSEADVRSALSQFLGTTRQIPPMFSALKVDGKRLYELARKGVEVERSAREIHVGAIELLSFAAAADRAVANVEVACSRGTYIRSLCRDIGAILDLPACMGFLLRTKSGVFALSDSVTLPELSASPSLIPADRLFPPELRVSVGHESALRFVQGQRIATVLATGHYAVLFGETLLGVGLVDCGILSPARVLVERSDLSFDCN
ncbi:MAG TPA: tRNA pseudouridine(55) synthase TruB [Bacillota bacterium]|nr:tRNA pseudouridine(55) synthase TruB [Bacillota bacterium]